MTHRPYPSYKESGVEWLGEVPEHWQVKRLGHLFRERNEDGLDDLPILSVSIHDGVSDKELDDKELDRKVTRSDDKSKYKRVMPGDLVYNMMRAWQGGFGSVTIEGQVSPAYVVACPLENFLTSHLEKILRTPNAIVEMKRLSQGVTDFRLRLYWEEFKTICALFPPLSEQQAIAAFLDRETAKIDGLVAEQERLIELLTEKRQTVISRAVTRGLDRSVPLKDSGVEWLGQVPDHWEVKSLKHLINPSTAITYGIVQAGPEIDDGIPYIKTSDMSGERLPTDGYSRTSTEIDEAYSRSRVYPGDLVISIRASVGKCLVVPDKLLVANLTQGTAKISPSEDVNRNFLYVAINSPVVQRYFSQMAKGATFKEITIDALRRTLIPLPPHPEQHAIAAYLDEQTSQFDTLMAEARRGIELLKERRTALISAAVTGKIDVREAV